MNTTSSAIQALAVLGGLYLAYRGLDQWKRQVVWTKNSELAEEAMLSANGLQTALRRIRSPMSYSDEGSSRPQNSDEAEEVKRHLNYKFTPLERLQTERAALSRFCDADARCRVRFPGVVPYFETLRAALVDVQSAASVRMQLANQDPYDQRHRDEFSMKLERTVLGTDTPESPDELGQRVDGAVLGLAKALKEYVKELP
ncbi:MAG: hypothetical protein AB7F74_00205 [Parvibaculaceae bacterium]